MNEIDHPDDLVTLVTRPTEFEANVLVAVLQEAGIKAFAFGALATTLHLGSRITPVPVQVRRADLERAKVALAQNVADSVDLDWDEVDLGEREDRLPLVEGRRMPRLARVGYLIAVLIVIGMLLGTVWLTFF
ncbi:MAG: DUF2007 domain-containing protein [Phycisphaerales bacterium]|nr:DUF2007 domain-containing protein [Phycisphaerales bacterium]MCI0630020.1 DUF2007 domain-containing protein [Phycisphaerales bacterium]